MNRKRIHATILILGCRIHCVFLFTLRNNKYEYQRGYLQLNYNKQSCIIQYPTLQPKLSQNFATFFLRFDLLKFIRSKEFFDFASVTCSELRISPLIYIYKFDEGSLSFLQMDPTSSPFFLSKYQW